MALVCKPFGDIITFTRASTATYFDSAGVLQTAAIDAPRFDYDPATLAAQGLLIEEQRTNLLTYSEQFDNAVWGPVAGTVTANATTAPSGAVTADRGVTNGVNFQVIQGATITSGATVSGSVFLKADGINEVELVLLASNNTTPYGRATFNVSTGVISTAASSANGGTNASASITAINNGWYRCVVTVTYPATTLAGMRINAAGATGGIFLWGAQLEAGAFPTSYIPTTTTALTRSADVASVNTLSPWFNSTASTLYAEWTPIAATMPTGSFQIVANISDGTSNNFYRIFQTQGAGTKASTNMFSGGVNPGRLDSGGAYSNATVKAASAFAALDRAISANGTAATTSATGALPIGVTSMALGTDGGSWLNGYLRRITYYPRKLSSAELQAITA